MRNEVRETLALLAHLHVRGCSVSKQQGCVLGTGSRRSSGMNRRRPRPPKTGVFTGRPPRCAGLFKQLFWGSATTLTAHDPQETSSPSRVMVITARAASPRRGRGSITGSASPDVRCFHSADVQQLRGGSEANASLHPASNQAFGGLNGHWQSSWGLSGDRGRTSTAQASPELTVRGQRLSCPLAPRGPPSGRVSRGLGPWAHELGTKPHREACSSPPPPA